MSDEEKEAIEILKLYFGDNPTLNITKYVNIVLNLIEKQSKEIEELNKENTRQHELIGNIHQKWKDKIKARIKELEEYLYKGNIKDDFLMIRIKAEIQALQSLLEKE